MSRRGIARCRILLRLQSHRVPSSAWWRQLTEALALCATLPWSKTARRLSSGPNGRTPQVAADRPEVRDAHVSLVHPRKNNMNVIYATLRGLAS